MKTENVHHVDFVDLRSDCMFYAVYSWSTPSMKVHQIALSHERFHASSIDSQIMSFG